ncbi:MAG: hypothetical protein ABI645_09755 [Pseudomonadota bacterium]
MKRSVAIMTVLVAILAPWSTARACSCARPNLTGLYEDSTRAFLGEVVEIKLLTKDPVDGQEATFAATVRPLETFKGLSNADVQVTFKRKYAAPTAQVLPLPDPTVIDPAFAERTVTLVDSGCGFGMSEGKYYIFEKQGEPLQYGGWCSPRVVYESIIVLDFMRGLRDAR